MYNGRFGGANIVEIISSANRQERMHIKVSKGAKIRNRYIQVPHLT